MCFLSLSHSLSAFVAGGGGFTCLLCARTLSIDQRLLDRFRRVEMRISCACVLSPPPPLPLYIRPIETEI